MVITDTQIAEMVRHALAEFPNEACGILATRNGTVVRVYPIANAEASPVRYRMDPQEQLRVMLELEDQEWDLGAVYHSHPRTRAYPSETDRALAFYPSAVYVIVSLADELNPDVRAFRMEGGEVVEEALEIQSETTV